MFRWLNARVALFALLLCIPMSALAQETTGSISGTVVDPDAKPVAFATVTVAGSRGERTVMTDDEGRFLVAFLPPGDYTVGVNGEGFAPILESGVRIALGQRMIKRFTMVPVMEESMDVLGTMPTINIASQTTGSNLPTSLIEDLPIGRNVANVVFLAPGVKSGGGTGGSNPSVNGSSGLENHYVFDGVNVTNAGFGSLGSYSRNFGSQGQGINFNFVEETQVITGGFSAEYGQAMGGIVNVVTKSGGNEWDGEIYGYWTPTGLQEDFKTPNLVGTPYAPYLGVERLDYGFGIGGPIVKDHLYFWAGLNPTKTTSERRSPSDEYALYDRGGIDRVVDSLNYAAKLSWQINQNHRLDLSFFGDPSETNFTWNRGSSALRQDNEFRFSELDYGSDNWALRYTGQVKPNFLIEASVAHARNYFSELFPDEYNQHRIIDLVPQQLGGAREERGGVGFYDENESINDQYQIKFTNVVKSHEIKYGVGHEKVDWNATETYTGPTWMTPDGQMTTSGAIMYRFIDDTFNGLPGVTETEGGDAVVYEVVRGQLSDPTRQTSTEYTFAFLQDDWSITPNLHLNFGVRYEKQKLTGEDRGYSLPAEWSPRIGMSWDHTGQGRSKLYGHWGRFFEKVPLDMAVRLFSNEVSILDGYYYDAELQNPIPDTFFQTNSGTTDVVDGTRNSKTDEILIGYERNLGDHWTVKAEYVYRELQRTLEDFQTGTASGILFGTDDFGTYVLGNIPPDAMLPDYASFPDPTREYHGLTLEATRRADDHWMWTIQYVLSSLRGNYEGLFRNDNGQDDPNLTALFDFPDEDLFWYTYAKGPLNTDRTHRMQSYGYYKWDNGWSVGGRFLVQTGVPELKLAAHPVYRNTGEVVLERRGDLGRTPTEWQLDMNFGKAWKLNTSFDSKIAIEVSIFNLFDQQVGTDFDYNWDSRAAPDASGTYEDLRESVANGGTPNPDYRKAVDYQNPREIRFGVKWTF